MFNTHSEGLAATTMYIELRLTTILYRYFCFSASNLAGLDWRASGSVAGRDGVVDVDQNARVVRRVSARERHLVPGVPCAGAAGDCRRTLASSDKAFPTEQYEEPVGESHTRKLSARDVELSTAGAAGTVEGDVLGTQQVLAILQTLGDGDGHGQFA